MTSGASHVRDYTDGDETATPTKVIERGSDPVKARKTRRDPLIPYR